MEGVDRELCVCVCVCVCESVSVSVVGHGHVTYQPRLQTTNTSVHYVGDSILTSAQNLISSAYEDPQDIAILQKLTSGINPIELQCHIGCRAA